MNTNCSLCGRPRTLTGGVVGCWRCDRADLWPSICPEVDPGGYARKADSSTFTEGTVVEVRPGVLDLDDPVERGDPR